MAIGAGKISISKMRQDRISDALLPSSGTAAPRLGHALLWTPSYVRDDKILWHVPFLFWLLEATRPRRYVELGVGEGVAYMAVCQALHRMRAHAQCFAVGEWRNEDGQIAVPERLAARNADLYEDFSQILSDGIGKAAEVIDDGSVDLMLVDLTEDESVAASLQQTWLPKLSSTGILLLNGIGRSNAENAELVEALSSKSPTIQMPGGDGLLVVLPSRGPDEELANIAALTPDDPAHKLIVQMFTRLGAGAYHEVHARQDSDRVEALDDRIRALIEERDSLAQRVEERDRQYDARHRKTAILQSHVFDLQIAAEAARAEAQRVADELSVAATDREEADDLLRQERSAHRDTRERADKASAEVEALRVSMEELTARAEEATKERERLSGELAAERIKQAESVALLRAERQDRIQFERERVKAVAESETLGKRVAELTSAADQHYRTVKDLVAALAENENLVIALTEELRSQRQESEAIATALAIEAEEVRAANAPSASGGGLLNRLTGRKCR